MTNIQADSRADGVKVEQNEHANSSSRPNFDVIGLLKEGAQSAAVLGKDIANGVVSTAKAFEQHFIDVPAISSSSVQPAAYKGYPAIDPTEENCETDIGATLILPAGVAGLFAGLKGGLEAGFLVAGPTGAGVGGMVGLVLGAGAGAGTALYGAHKACEWMASEARGGDGGYEA